MNTIEQIRDRFPALQQKIYGKSLVYLDNSATTQKPLEVLEVLQEMNGGINGNIHRAVHYLSARCTERYEAARHTIQEFIHAARPYEIIYTSGTTASINMLAYCFGQKYVRAGDHILVTNSEHHSNLVPWQMLCLRTGAVLDVWTIRRDGTLDLEVLEQLLQAQPPKILCFPHISNVLGIVNPVREITALAHKYGVPVLVDGAQGIVHRSIDVQQTDVDFYVFSGHKLYGPTGTGILYGKEKYLEEMEPWQGGGDMIASVSLTQGTTYAALPMKFEAGTANYIGAAAMGAAVDFVRGLDAGYMEDYARRLTRHLQTRLQEIDGLTVWGQPPLTEKVPLFTLSIDGAHPNDMALLLDQLGIAVRSGQLCAEPLLAFYGQTAVLRASFAAYNTLQEADYLVDSLKKVVGMLR